MKKLPQKIDIKDYIVGRIIAQTISILITASIFFILGVRAASDSELPQFIFDLAGVEEITTITTTTPVSDEN